MIILKVLAPRLSGIQGENSDFGHIGVEVISHVTKRYREICESLWIRMSKATIWGSFSFEETLPEAKIYICGELHSEINIHPLVRVS